MTHLYSTMQHNLKQTSQIRSSPLYNHNSQQIDIRQQNKKLHTIIRNHQTKIIRFEGQIEQLKRKIQIMAYSKKDENQRDNSKENLANDLNIFIENRDLKENNQILHEENMMLNGKNNVLEAEKRQFLSDIKALKTKIKELDIIEKMRQQRFKDEVSKLTPIIVQQSSEYTAVKEGLQQITTFMRQRFLDIPFHMFLLTSKQLNTKKSTSSFTIFKSYWHQLLQNKNLYIIPLLKSYKLLSKLFKTIDENYGELNQEQYRDTMNQWVINNVVEIKNQGKVKEKQQKLFRFMGLLYRSKFPIKGQKYEMDEDVKGWVGDAVAREIQELLEGTP